MAQFQAERDLLAQQSDQKIQNMIEISEHEQILNQELNKVNQIAQDKLNQIQVAMEQQYKTILEEKVKDLENSNQHKLVQVGSEYENQLKQVRLENDKLKNQLLGQESSDSHKLQSSEDRVKVLQEELQMLKQMDQEREVKWKESERVKDGERERMQRKVDEQESMLIEKDRELNRLYHVNRELNKKYMGLKSQSDVIICQMAESALSCGDEMQAELAKNRQDIRHMQEEYNISISEVKRIFT